MTRFKLVWNIRPHDTGKMLRDFLKEQNISRAALTDIKFHGGNIFVNDQEVNVRYILQENDQLEIQFPPEVISSSLMGEKIPLNIVYEDEFVLIVNKPANMNSIPSREHPKGSLANALVGYFQEIGLEATVHIVTRLDRNTTGLVLIAKHRHIHHLFSKQQKTNQVKRKYIAFVEGKLDESRGMINEPIGRKTDSIIEREVRTDGQYALTHYRVIQTLPPFTMVELELGTGRTHQIRVHMSYIGHPLVGDDLYGGKLDLMNRQALHCKQLSFYHPILHKRMEFTEKLPQDMEKVIRM